MHARHRRLVALVHRVELLEFQRHLLLNVVRHENRLQILPRPLSLHPDLQRVLYQNQPLLQIVRPLQNRLDVRRALHENQLVEVLLQQRDRLI